MNGLDELGEPAGKGAVTQSRLARSCHFQATFQPLDVTYARLGTTTSACVWSALE